MCTSHPSTPVPRPQVQELLAETREGLQKASGGVGGEEGECVVDGVIESPVVIRSKRVGKRMSIRESVSEMDRQLKRLFRAIQDEDTNLVGVG